MHDNGEVKFLFVINAGAGPDESAWDDIIGNYFSGKSFKVEYYHLEPKPDSEKLKKYISQSQAEKVIAVGGDGTVGMVAKLVAGTDKALGILPGGSANGMAKELNISEVPEEALAIIENGEIRCCDAIKINEEVCFHLSDIGLNAQLIKYFDEGKLRGKLGYAKVILKTLWRRRKMRITVTGKTDNIQREAFMVVIANASKYGTGAVINPGGKPDDGWFEVVIVRKLALSELLKMIFKPQPFNPEKIEILQAKSLTIETHRKVHFQVDGEYLGKIDRLKATILPKHINLILPEKSGNVAS